MRSFLLSVSILLMTALPALSATYPQTDGERVKFTAQLDMPRGYISGVCVLMKDGEWVRGCFFNEFGISAISFSYHKGRDRVKLHDVIAMLDKWYIRRVLRKDLRQVMRRLEQGQLTYRDEKYKIDYHFTPLDDDTQE